MQRRPTGAPRSASAELAAAVLAGDQSAALVLARGPLELAPDNLVERPWGGRRLWSLKGLPGSPPAGHRFGESFEVSACPSDDESARHPSAVRLGGGATLELPRLLRCAPVEFLGAPAAAAWGAELPLLPKLLDVGEFLSVQAHPPGQVEAYFVLEARPGATIRLGFAREVDPVHWRRRLEEGRSAQEFLAAALSERLAQAEFRKEWNRAMGAADAPRLEGLAGGLDRRGLAALRTLVSVQSEVLRDLNRVPVAPGDVLFNARRTAGVLRADVHALGNPEGHELVVLEIRRPGPTLRAWDHGRFPLRELRIAGALDAMAHGRAEPQAYRVRGRPGRAGVWRWIECEHFVADELRLEARVTLRRSSPGGARTLHVLEGELSVQSPSGAELLLAAGRSTLLPHALSEYEVVAPRGPARALEVSIPMPAPPARPHAHE